MIDILLLTIGFFWLIFATFSDIKTREIPDWLSYSLIIIALTTRLIYSIIFKQISFFFYGLIGFTIFLGIALLFYYSKQWGGGDSKLLMGIGALFATYPETLIKYFNPNLNLPFLLSLLINILVFGALYGIIYSLVLVIKNKDKFKKQFLDLYNKTKKQEIIFLITAVVLLIFTLLIENIYIKLSLLGLILILLIIPILWIFIKATELACMYKFISTNKLTPGDWIAQDIKINKKIIYNKNSIGVNKNQIELFKKLKIKKVLIKEGIPFTPSFLLGIIISLIFGNIIFFMF